jgi:aminomethyltransferase
MGGRIVPQPSPFYQRQQLACTSFHWKDWAGTAAVSSYTPYSEREYHALRQTAGMIDVSPLFKYDVTGPDALKALDRLMCRDIRKIRRGRVIYTSWTDERGKMLDDGTVAQIGEQHFRVTSSEPWLRWFNVNSRGLDVHFEDTTKQLAALSLQGPNARKILKEITTFDMNKMRFFRIRKTKLAGFDVWISRTGYTGDLGYEIWMQHEDALGVWDALVIAGKPWGIEPCGLDAMDIARIEAGFVLQGVDYITAPSCFLDRQTSTPFEAGLGWTVDLDKPSFIGQDALRQANDDPNGWSLVGLETVWEDLERVYGLYNLPPSVCTDAWRSGLPLYDTQGERQVGYATSGAWSPILKRNLALATVPSSMAAEGTLMRMEHTVEYQRYKVLAKVVKRPFFDPERKRSIPPAEAPNE